MLSTANVANTGNVLIDALTWGQKWVGSTGPLQIKVGFKLANGLLPTLAESNAVQAVLAEFERVINVDFQFIGVDYANAADLTVQIRNDYGSASYGWSLPPGETRAPGFGDANILRNNYTGNGLSFDKGSFDYISFLHEFAHVMGLAHPHDAGGGSGIFPGVTGPNTLGQFGLNQGVFTTMSYNDGWQTQEIFERTVFHYEDATTGQKYAREGFQSRGPLPVGAEFGLQGGLMALDISALQNIYGANTSQASGDSQYVLPTQNVVGTSFVCIWDTGGVDTILNTSGLDVVIDLRSATGLVAEGGGGFISAVTNVRGGFTIAAGVTIENATSGAGNDRLLGNAAANILVGGEGNDALTGFAGKDELWGGAGSDQFIFHSDLESGPTILSADMIKDFNSIYDVIDLIGIDANSLVQGNQSFRFLGLTSSFLTTGDLRYGYNGGNTALYLNTDADMSSETVIVLSGVHELSADDFIL